ncbi:MAG TPA: prepilin-type N-terminal cleavage/methylation domain-containing protein [Candidatus Gracilibacteria bacterium]|nr:prepilin-type N-terminal cleavage/methylation domain-containing protein [Candidatus Gracilibacteria bacterium]
MNGGKKRTSKGFTLIELLIVITIIGILATSLLPSVLGAPARARDAARKAAINNIIAGLENYSADNNDYPEDTLCFGDYTGVNGADELNAYFSGGVIPPDPQEGGTATGLASCEKGQYLYCRLDGNPGNYYIATYIETFSTGGGGCTPGELLPGFGSTGDVAAPDCFVGGVGGDEPPVFTDDGPYALYYEIQ